MRLFRSDRIFEEALTKPDGYEKLLTQLQRARKWAFVCHVGFLIAMLAACGWILVVACRAIKGTPSPMAEWLLANRGLLVVIAGPLIGTIIQQFVFMMHCDACVKMMLVFRGRQNSSVQVARERSVP
jgi:hypothetical protein